MNELVSDNRCQAAVARGQCLNPAEPGGVYCRQHLGASALSTTRRFYRLNRPEVQERIDSLSGDGRLMSLREGIALMHAMIEERFNLIKCDAEKIAGFPQISSMLLTLERLVRSTTELELKLDSLLSKDALNEFGRSVVEIISRNLEGMPDYEEVVDRILEEILQSVTTVSNKDTSPLKSRGGRPKKDGVIDVQ